MFARSSARRAVRRWRCGRREPSIMRDGKWTMEVIMDGNAQPEHVVDGRTCVEAVFPDGRGSTEAAGAPLSRLR